MGRALVASFAAAVALIAPATAAAASSADIAALQVALRARGFYAGSVDGVAGPGDVRGDPPAAAAARHPGRRDRRPADSPRARAPRPAAPRQPAARRRRPRVGRRGAAVPARDPRLPLRRRSTAASARTRDAALRRFQAWAGLHADGVAGAATLAALRRGRRRARRCASAARSATRSATASGRAAPASTPGSTSSRRAGGRCGAGARGCVEVAHRDSGGYGKLVVLRHGLGMTSWYAHLSRITVRRGPVRGRGRADRPGRLDRRSTGPHLHFELRAARGCRRPRRRHRLRTTPSFGRRASAPPSSSVLSRSSPGGRSAGSPERFNATTNAPRRKTSVASSAASVS